MVPLSIHQPKEQGHPIHPIILQKYLHAFKVKNYPMVHDPQSDLLQVHDTEQTISQIHQFFADPLLPLRN